MVLLHYYRQKILLFTKYTKQMYLVNKKPGSDLLSHGESPHYHRHYNISLLSSAWDQVVLLHYYRQKILLFTKYTKQMYLVNKKPGSDLLSHGESPHYHRHYNISLLSSAWIQVVLLHSRRQDYPVYTLLLSRFCF